MAKKLKYIPMILLFTISCSIFRYYDIDIYKFERFIFICNMKLVKNRDLFYAEWTVPKSEYKQDNVSLERT